LLLLLLLMSCHYSCPVLLCEGFLGFAEYGGRCGSSWGWKA
jgi:hypothetical protein